MDREAESAIAKSALYSVFVIEEKAPTMAILSPKRQVTLPKELCDRLGVRPGDHLDLLDDGRITILKKGRGAERAYSGRR